MTVDEYLAFEETSDERHEFFDGQIFAMSGGTDAHDRLSGAAFAELRAALRGRPCSPNASNVRIKSHATGLYTYADASVSCEPRRFEDARRTTLLNPRVVVEVLSASTERYDRGEKFAHYRAMDSVEHYVLVSTTERQVEVFTRATDSWELRIYGAGSVVPLPSIDALIDVDALYDGVSLDPAPTHEERL
jgi:Uma2 family endonuclease